MPSTVRDVDLLLLAALAAGPAHGYRLVDTLRERSGGAFKLAEGTVYPALYRLEARRLVASRWQTVDGRRRRVYRLTRRGAAALEDQRAAWYAQVRAMEAVLA